MLPVFVINLDRSTDRLAKMRGQCAAIGVSFERFPGVLGTDLPPALKPYFCDAAGNIVSPLRPAEIGCYASHLGVWQRVVEVGLPAAMVCEDDAILPSGIDGLVDEILKFLPPDWDMVLLASISSEATKPLHVLSSGASIVRYSKVPGCMACYLISRAGAAKMLRAVAPRMWTNDVDSRWPWKFGMDTYGVLPRLVEWWNLTSTINPAGGGRLGGGRSALRSGMRRSNFRTLESFLFNLRKLGPYWWTRCFIINCGVKTQKLLVPLRRSVGWAAPRVVRPVSPAYPEASRRLLPSSVDQDAE
ncbi:MAG: glycosyltransferase family 25 protein [Hyphomicrobiaceae bacterium]|nr:glycosyltransferase family 25 protein [Hyphomicrobiaceae bacterium]